MSKRNDVAGDEEEVEVVRAANSFLSEKPLRDSYLIAKVNKEESQIYIDDIEDPSGVLAVDGETVCARGDEDAVESLIEQIPSGTYHFHSIDEDTFETIKASDVKIEDDHPTWMHKRPKEVFSEAGVDCVELKEEDAEVIDNYWGLGEEDSTEYIRERIRDGPAYGIRRDGGLVAWCMTHYITSQALCLGFLHVKEGWRRKGFAKALTEVLSEYALEKGMTPVVDIFQDNEASLSLAEDIGFVRLGENHWFQGEV